MDPRIFLLLFCLVIPWLIPVFPRQAILFCFVRLITIFLLLSLCIGLKFYLLSPFGNFYEHIESLLVYSLSKRATERLAFFWHFYLVYFRDPFAFGFAIIEGISFSKPSVLRLSGLM